LVAEVVVHRRDVGVRRRDDLADGDLLEAVVREEMACGLDQPLARVALLDDGDLRRHSVRRKRRVASVMATAEKIVRYVMSQRIALIPVFFSSRHLNACTA